MSAPGPAGPAPEGRGLQPSAFGRPSPALLARADRGYARFLASITPAVQHDHTGDHDKADAARQRRATSTPSSTDSTDSTDSTAPTA